MKVDSEKVIQFSGSLENIPDARFAATIRFHRWDPTWLSVDLLWYGPAEDRRKGPFGLEHSGRNHMMLVSDDDPRLSVELLGITKVETHHTKGTAHSTSIRVAAIQAGITSHAALEDQRYSVIVRLQPSGILALPTIQTESFTGEVTTERILEGAMEVKVSHGKLDARDSYEFYTTEEFGNRVRHRVERASLMGEIIVPKGMSLDAVHESLKIEIDGICSALSLAYRRPVNFYEVMYLGHSEEHGSSEAFLRRRWQSTIGQRGGDELINTRGLIDGGLQQLVDAIRTSPDREAITRAIQFLSSSYDATTTTAYFMAFSAMETIINVSVGEDAAELLAPSAWKSLEKRLKTAIKEFDPAAEISQEMVSPTVWERFEKVLSDTIDEFGPDVEAARDVIKKKLPELRRASLVDRATAAAAKFNPKIADLWPRRSFADGLKDATKLRNNLFHAAQAESGISLARDLVRIRTFTERLLLKVLGWPDERIWTWYDQDLKWLNQG